MWFYRPICAKILEGVSPYSKAGRRYYGKGKKAETEVLFLVGERASRLWEQYVHMPERIKNMAESVYQTVDVIFRAQELDHQLRFHYFRWDLQDQKELRNYCVDKIMDVEVT